MSDYRNIRAGMAVKDPHGVSLGEVDGVDGARIKLKRSAAADGQHHYVRIADVTRVDDYVHLSLAGAAALAQDTAGVTGGGAATHHAQKNALARLLPWLLLLAGLIALIVALTRNVQRDEPGATASTTTATPSARAQTVTLPGGQTVDLIPDTLNYSLQQFLAGSAAAPQTFTFDRLNFDTGSAAIRTPDAADLDALARILAAYPTARVTITGYADARGAADTNADLGAQRARAVVDALTARGVGAERLTAQSGGEANPKASNATPEGRFENRRSELTVTAR